MKMKSECGRGLHASARGHARAHDDARLDTESGRQGKNDHRATRNFENRSDRAGKCYSQNDDQYAGGRSDTLWPTAPERAYKTRTPNRSLLADNCGNRNQVIGFGRVF